MSSRYFIELKDGGTDLSTTRSIVVLSFCVSIYLILLAPSVVQFLCPDIAHLSQTDHDCTLAELVEGEHLLPDMAGLLQR